MKKTIFISILLAFVAMSFTTINLEELKINTGGFGWNDAKWFSVNGSASTDFVESMFAKFPNTKRKGYIWKFNNVKVPGIEKAVTFQINQGVHYGMDETGYSGFNTFTNKTVKLLTSREEKSEKIEKGILIYVNKRSFGRKSVIFTDKDEELVKVYLLSIYKG